MQRTGGARGLCYVAELDEVWFPARDTFLYMLDCSTNTVVDSVGAPRRCDSLYYIPGVGKVYVLEDWRFHVYDVRTGTLREVVPAE